jgi:hypothetical protein
MSDIELTSSGEEAGIWTFLVDFLIGSTVTFVLLLVIFVEVPFQGNRLHRVYIRWSKSRQGVRPRLVPRPHDTNHPARFAYKYKPLGCETDIRILVLNPGREKDEISCHLLCASLYNSPDFEALSYAWGDPNATRTVMCSDATLEVTANLYRALWHLRQIDCQTFLWADALCINQDDLEERSQQVQIMGEIYKRAERCLVWLGEEIGPVKNSLETIDNLYSVLPGLETIIESSDRSTLYKKLMEASAVPNQLGLGDKGEKNILDLDWEPLSNLLRNPWFSRKWVIQEVAKAKQAIVVCGDKRLPWDYLERTFIHMKINGIATYIPTFLYNEENPDKTHPAVSSMQNTAIIAGCRRSWMDGDLVGLILGTRYFRCTNQSDHIYALLSLLRKVSPEHWELHPNYRLHPGEVFKRFATWCITRNRDLRFLAAVSEPLENPEVPVPSWVPNLAAPLDCAISHLSAGDSFAATRDSDLQAWLSDDNTILHFTGKSIDTIKVLGRNMLSSANTLGSTEDGTIAGYRIGDEGPLLRVWNFLHGLPDQDDIIRFHWLSKLAGVRAWLRECQSIALGEHQTMTPTRHNEFWRTMICDMTSTASRAPSNFGEHFSRYIKIFEHDTDQSDITSVWALENIIDTRHVDIPLVVGAGSRRFCCTENGRLGCMPNRAEVGDMICIFLGAGVPYVIRPCGNDRYTFIGECYLHGVMDGEAMDMEDIKLQEFALC